MSPSDTAWLPGTDGKPCNCGHCLICEVEALTGPGDSAEAAEVEGEVFAAQFDDDPSPYAGDYSED